MRRDDGETGEFHPGVDIANSPDTLISATADGTVLFSGWSHGYGNLVVIDHGYGIQTVYGHTSKALVKVGDRVVKGQVIAGTGITGGTTIVEQVSGTAGGAGTYITSVTNTASAASITTSEIISGVAADQTLVAIQANQIPQLAAINISVGVT